MTIKIQAPQVEGDLKPRIVVVGVGGAGGNAVNNMIRSNLEGVEFVVANTDAQALKQSQADRKIQLGAAVTKGLGAGARISISSSDASSAPCQASHWFCSADRAPPFPTSFKLLSSRSSQRDGTVGSPSTRQERVIITSGAAQHCAKSCADRPILRSCDGRPNSARISWLIHGSASGAGGQLPSFRPPKIITSAH